MINLNRICAAALILGATAVVTPAMAQAAADNAQAPSQTDATVQTAAGDRAMTHDMDVKAASNANVDSVGNTSKKYVRSRRAADFAKEQSITQQLNQQASAAASPTVR